MDGVSQRLRVREGGRISPIPAGSPKAGKERPRRPNGRRGHGGAVFDLDHPLPDDEGADNGEQKNQQQPARGPEVRDRR